MSAAMTPDRPPDVGDMMTTAEVALMLRMTRRTVERKARTGLLPAARVGKRWLFPRAKIERIAKMREWDEGRWA